MVYILVSVFFWEERSMGSENQSRTLCHRRHGREDVPQKSLAQKRIRPRIVD
jgi:hypothetical protein